MGSIDARLDAPADRSAQTAPARGVTEPQADGAASPGQAEQPAAPSAAPNADNGGIHPPRDPHRARRALGWIALSVGAEAAVIAVATSIMIEHQKGERDSGCDAQKVCDTNGFNAVGTIDSLVPWNTASWFVAAAGLAAGTVLLIISPHESEQTAAITVSPTAAGLAAGFRSTF
jgi:hypothetical protein